MIQLRSGYIICALLRVPSRIAFLRPPCFSPFALPTSIRAMTTRSRPAPASTPDPPLAPDAQHFSRSSTGRLLRRVDPDRERLPEQVAPTPRARRCFLDSRYHRGPRGWTYQMETVPDDIPAPQPEPHPLPWWKVQVRLVVAVDVVVVVAVRVRV